MSSVTAATSIRELTAPLLARLPVTSPELDEIIDATIICFTRHGPTRGSVADVARELRVTRATVYRNGGNLMQLANLVAARELRRHLEQVPAVILDSGDGAAMIAFAIEIVKAYLDHPVVQKVLHDEPDLMGKLICQSYPRAAAEIVSQIVGFVDAGMAAGGIRRGDPTVVAETYVRLCVLAVAVPPLTAAEEHLRSVLSPLLLPDNITS